MCVNADFKKGVISAEYTWDKKVCQKETCAKKRKRYHPNKHRVIDVFKYYKNRMVKDYIDDRNGVRVKLTFKFLNVKKHQKDWKNAENNGENGERFAGFYRP